MEDCRYVKAAEVAEMIGVSRAKAYKMVAAMNEELKAKNYLVISGRVPRKFLMEKLYDNVKIKFTKMDRLFFTNLDRII